MRVIRTLGLVGTGLLVALGTWGCSDDDVDSVCGNGLIEGTEQCDDTALGGNDCTTVPGDFTGGTLGCTSSCAFDTSQCNNDAVECGDGVVNQQSESCDGTDLAGNGCADVGNFTGGTLACNNDCTFDTSSCEAEELCGNGAVDTGEECDGSNLDGNDCTDVGNFTGGTLACNNDCTFDTTDCDVPLPCGNGTIDTGEQCDGNNLDGNTCADMGNFNSGDLACNTDCTFDTTDCAYVLTPSEQLTAVRATADGTGLTLPLDNVWVTYVKDNVGGDPAGFFVQAEQLGPALFVVVDPATLTPAPAVGAEVSFTVLEMSSDQGRREAATISGWSVVSSGNPVANLVQTVSSATDLVSGLDGYEAELITVDGTLVSDLAYGGSGHQSAQVDTAGVTGVTNLKLRVSDTVQAQLDLQNGCTFTVTQTPMWRYFAQAQISAYDAAEVTVHSCPAPQVISATATGDATVLIVMSRTIDASSVLPAGTQFTFDNGLTATAASAMGNEITVLTSAQTAGATYLVTVAGTVTDLLGTGVDPSADTATFLGFGTPAVEGACDDGLDGDGDGYVDCEDAECAADAACAWGSQLYISEVDADTPGTDTAEFLEIWNNTGGPVDLATEKYFVVLVNGNGEVSYGAYQLTGTLAAGDVYVVGNLGGVEDLPFGPATDALQNGADGIILVRCDACTTAAADFPNGTVITGAATFTTAGANTATWIDGVAYDTNDADDAGLMTACGVSAQWNEDMDGTKDTESLHRTSVNGWSMAPPSAGTTDFE